MLTVLAIEKLSHPLCDQKCSKIQSQHNSSALMWNLCTAQSTDSAQCAQDMCFVKLLSSSSPLSFNMQISLQERPHNLVQDILSEVSAYQKIKHKNIVKLYGVEIQHVCLSHFIYLPLSLHFSIPLSLSLPPSLPPPPPLSHTHTHMHRHSFLIPCFFPTQPPEWITPIYGIL